ncbi:MAG: AAA family ATPase, partial [Chloroflexota bacterium]
MSAHQESTGEPQTASRTKKPLQLIRRVQPEIMTAEAFLEKDLPPLRPIIPGLIPEGALLLAGAPKAGKSRLALALAIAVATGRPALAKIDVERRAVLYLCLEDGERMTQDRMQSLLDGAPNSLDIAFEWPKVEAGCEAELEHWLEAHPDAGLVVVDTLERIRPENTAYQSVYKADYAACAPLSDLAHRYRICVLIIHHTRKSRVEDAG